MTTVLFRTDASAEIGTGHVMRCLALAETVIDTSGRAVFLSAHMPQGLRGRVLRAGCTLHDLAAKPYGVEDAQETAQATLDAKAQWIVVDGYHFDATYQDVLQHAGMHVLFMDDYVHTEHYSADYVLNQNIYASEQLYHSKKPKGKLLLGTRYALLRKEFQHSLSHGERVRMRGSKNVLITLGGIGDRELATTIQNRLRKDRDEVQIASGAADMPSLMQWANVAVSAGGTTVYELAYMGVPAILLVRAGNQHMVAEGMAKAGCAVNLGHVEHVTVEDIAREVTTLLSESEKRQQMAERGRRLVDGEGAERVLMELTGSPLRLRDVRLGDAERIWEWANDAETRQASFSPNPIPWEDHQQWFMGRLQDPHTLFFVALNRSDTPLGYIRFEGSPHATVLSLAIAPNRRGQGYGSALLKDGCQLFFRRREDTRVSAYVKTENARSAALFHKAGFRQLSRTTVGNHPALHFVLERDMIQP